MSDFGSAVQHGSVMLGCHALRSFSGLRSVSVICLTLLSQQHYVTMCCYICGYRSGHVGVIMYVYGEIPTFVTEAILIVVQAPFIGET